LEQITDMLTRQNYLKEGREFRPAFKEFIGNENFEERADPEATWIDAPVLRYLLKKFSGVIAG
jgi:hypothetical protein